MKKAINKQGVLISILVSCLIALPRMLNAEMANVEHFFVHFLYLFILSFCYWITTQLFIQKVKKTLYYILLLLLLCGIFSITYNFVVQLIFKDSTVLYSDLPFFNRLTLHQARVMLFSRGVIISGVIYFIGYYLNILAEKQKASIEIEQLKKEKLSAQLEELKQQMSPHFLFNSLNTLKTIVPDENSKTYIVKLANVYRYLLSFNSKHLTTLKDELDFVESYLYILKERFEDALEITIDIDESLMENYIPPLSLQLLIENAIKHNIVSMDDPLKINVTNNNSKDMLIISNNLQLKSSKENSTGMGLDNIKTRYQLLAQKDILISKNENSFSIQIPLLLNSHSPI